MATVKVDSASLIAAALLALLQAVGRLGAWGLSHGMGVAMLWSVPVLAGKILLKTILQGLCSPWAWLFCLGCNLNLRCMPGSAVCSRLC